MFLARFDHGGVPRLGARLDDDHLLDVTAAVPTTEADPLLALIRGGSDSLRRVEEALADPRERDILDPTTVAFMAPLQPPRMRNFSVYEGHIRNAFEAGIEMRAGRLIGAAVRRSHVVRPPRGWYRRPAYYKGNHLSVVGPYDDIVSPAYTTQLDYELELAVIVGAAGSNIPENEAMDHVFGYTLLDDVSARDVLPKELLSPMGPAKGKDFDTGNVLGPWVATRDEIPDPRALTGRVTVNGSERARCTTSDMHHSVASMIAEASRGETLAVGEVFGTGCCTWGSGIEKKQFLKPGDIVELQLGPFGTQRNTVLSPVR